MTKRPKPGPTEQATLQTVKRVLEKAELEPEPIPEGNGYVVRFTDGPPVRGIALLYPQDARLVFYLEFLEAVPQKARPSVAEYTTRANFGMTMGNFELDHESGIARFKTSVDFVGADLSEALVRNVVLDAMDVVEIYADGLLQVAHGKCSPLEAIRQAEG
jgi:hypothetical protein